MGFIFFLPMYSEAKVAFVVCLWHPQRPWALSPRVARLAPFLSKHEPEIDRRIDETRMGFGDVVVRLQRRHGVGEGEVRRRARCAATGDAHRRQKRDGSGGDGVHEAEEAVTNAEDIDRREARERAKSFQSHEYPL